MKRIAEITVVFLIAILGILASYYGISYFLKSEIVISNRECILEKKDWPQVFTQAIDEAESRHIALGVIRVFRAPHGVYYWNSQHSQELLDLMNRRWKLAKVGKEHPVVAAILENMPLEFSSMKQDKNKAYYVSSEYLPDGEWKGHLYCVIDDKENNTIIVRYYYNF